MYNIYIVVGGTCKLYVEDKEAMMMVIGHKKIHGQGRDHFQFSPISSSSADPKHSAVVGLFFIILMFIFVDTNVGDMAQRT